MANKSQLYLQIAKVQAEGAKKMVSNVEEILGGYRTVEVDPDTLAEAANTLEVAVGMLRAAAETAGKHQAILAAEEAAQAAADAAEVGA